MDRNIPTPKRIKAFMIAVVMCTGVCYVGWLSGIPKLFVKIYAGSLAFLLVCLFFTYFINKKNKPPR